MWHVKGTTKHPNPETYTGMFLENYETDEKRKSKWVHKIFLFNPIKHADVSEEFLEKKLSGIVNVYEHSIYDFEFNAWKIIKHFKKCYGIPGIRMFTIGQPIQFRVVKGQTPFVLPLFAFFVNYCSMIPLIDIGVPMNDWKPWNPQKFTNDAWEKLMNEYIEICRPYANMRKICEGISLGKYLMNMFCSEAGDRFGLSISINDFIEVMNRSEEAYKSITCQFEIPEDVSLTDREIITMKRTKDLLKFIGEQRDLPISVYARNGLFNPNQFREFAVHITHKPSLDGATVPYTYPTNILMGISDPRAHVVDARGGRKAEMTKLNVSKAGTLERSLMMMMSPIRWVDLDYECDSKHFRKKTIKDYDDLEKIDGRVYTKDPKSDRYRIVYPRKDTNLIGSTIYLKTPITCTHPKRSEGYVCAACYGMLMSNLNCDIHVGRVAAADSSDEIEQKLLSAKHALKTDTVRIKFPDEFYQYFELGNGTISFNSEMIDASAEHDEDFENMYLEFYPNAMKKLQDGENRHHDRSFTEIVIYNANDDTRTTISEENQLPLYLSPEFNNDFFLPAYHYKDEKEAIRIPFNELIDGGKVILQNLFEFNYMNNELANPLLTLENIMFNAKSIAEFSSYDDCMDTIIPLFVKGGIHVPDYQSELLVAKMVIGPDGQPVDWNDPNPEYTFQSINKSIARNPSALTSILYRESGQQIAGTNDTYEKTGASEYAYFFAERQKSSDI